MSRFAAIGTWLVLLAAPVAAPAADKPAMSDGPMLVVRLQSISQLLDNAEYLIDIAGAKDDLGVYLGTARAFLGDKSIDGVDATRPFIVYGSTSGKVAESTGVVMVPIADQTAFVKMLKDRLNLTIKEEKEGFYSTTAPNTPAPIHFRFANEYVYIYVSMAKPAFIDE